MNPSKTSKKMTFIMLSAKGDRIRQVSMTRSFRYGLYLGIICLFTLIGKGIFDYRAMRTQLAGIPDLLKQNRRQKAELMMMADRLDTMRMELERFRLAARQFEAQTGSEIDDTGLVSGVGGSDEALPRTERRTLNPKGPWVMMGLLGPANYGPRPAAEKALYGTGRSFRRLRKVDRQQIKRQLKAVAKEFGLDPRLALGMARIESGFDPHKVSPRGAVGVLQVMPKFVRLDYGIHRDMLFDPQINIRVGLWCMKSLMDRFDQDLELSLAAYNAGASRVVRAGYQVPPIRETRAYVQKVMDAMENEA